MELKSKIITGATIVLGVIIVFSVLSSMMPVAQTTGNSLNDSNLCSAAGCFYNVTTSVCQSSVTNASMGGCATATSVPLSGLFSGTGVIFIIIMIMMFILIISGIIKKK